MLGEIITKANIGRQQLTREETQTAIGIWYEMLYGVVPEKRLNECYLRAMRNRTNTFALAPTEIVMAWNEIKSSEMYRNNPARQLTHGFCERCNNTGTELIRNDLGQVRGGRPCAH